MRLIDARIGQQVRVDLAGLELAVPEVRGTSVVGVVAEVNPAEEALKVRITLPTGQQRYITVSPGRVQRW